MIAGRDASDPSHASPGDDHDPRRAAPACGGRAAAARDRATMTPRPGDRDYASCFTDGPAAAAAALFPAAAAAALFPSGCRGRVIPRAGPSHSLRLSRVAAAVTVTASGRLRLARRSRSRPAGSESRVCRSRDWHSQSQDYKYRPGRRRPARRGGPATDSEWASLTARLSLVTSQYRQLPAAGQRHLDSVRPMRPRRAPPPRRLGGPRGPGRRVQHQVTVTPPNAELSSL